MRTDALSASGICILFSFITLISCQDGGTSQAPTQSTLGSTQIYQPPPTILLTPQTESCIFYDSRDNRSRECPLFPSNSCFSFIRRQTDGTFYIKRGCSFNCQNDTRNRKIQVCCRSHLCNNHVLSEANFTSLLAPPPPTRCHQSLSNGTCDMTTACYSRLTYRSDGTYEAQQGCIRGSECEQRADNRVIQNCCTSDLCNTPIPPSAHPRNNPTFTPSTPSPPSSSESPLIPSFSPPGIEPGPGDSTYPICNCDNCKHSSSTCRGLRCGKKIEYTHNPEPTVTLMCVTDITMCTDDRPDLPDPSPGNVDIHCCASDRCNQREDLPSFPVPSSATPTPTQAQESTELPRQETTTSTTSATTSLVTSSSDTLYFTFTAVVSVVGGAIVMGVVLVLVVLILRRTRKKSSKRKVSSQQPSPDSHVTARYVHTVRDSPLSSKSSGSTSSSSSNQSGPLLDTEFLKHLGTSV